MAKSNPKRAPDGLAKAIECLAAGNWQQAHEIVQQHKSALGAWLHGIVHTLEGDLSNARYWYRKTDRAFPGPDAVQDEIAAARIRVLGGESRSARRPPGSRPASRKR